MILYTFFGINTHIINLKIDKNQKSNIQNV